MKMLTITNIILLIVLASCLQMETNNYSNSKILFKHRLKAQI
jgi:hypothetical protein